MFIERSAELDLQRIRSGDPGAIACRDEHGRKLSRAEAS
jgi:hypothetical protein